MRVALAAMAAVFTMQLPMSATAQTLVSEAECAATYSADEWQLEVFYQEPGFLYDQPGVGYHYTHTPSGFSVVLRMFRDQTTLPGFNLEPLLDTSAVKGYFDGIERRPVANAFESGSYAGELQFAAVDHGSSSFWRVVGDLTYNWDPVSQRAAFFFDPDATLEHEAALIRKLAESDADDFELQLDFQPDGERPHRLRAISLSTAGIARLFANSRD